MAKKVFAEDVSRRTVLRGAGAIGGAAAVSSLLAACSGQAGSAGTAGSTLSIWHWEPTFQPVLKQLIGQYEAEHKGLKITQRYLPYASFNTALQASLAAKTDPDIYFPGTSLIALGQAGRTLDLKKELGEKFLSQIYTAANQQGQYKGGQYGIGWEVDILVLYYNKKILSQAGVQPPETWDDVIRIAPIIREKTNTLPLALYGNPNNALSDFFLPFITQAANDPTEELKLDLLTGGATWDTPHVVEAFQKLIDLINAKVFDPGILSIDQDSSFASYTGGKAAMMYTGEWFVPTAYTTASKEFLANEFAVTKVPAWSPGARHWAGDQAGDVWAVSARSKNKTAALDFLQWLYEPTRYAQIMNKTLVGLPATAAAGKLMTDPYLKEMGTYLAEGDGCPHILFGQGSFTSVGNVVAGVFQGKYSAEGAAKAIQSAVLQARK